MPTELNAGQTTNSLPFDLSLLLVRWCGVYRTVYGAEHWAARAVLRGRQDPKIISDFTKLLIFLKKNGMPVGVGLTNFENYLSFAMSSFASRAIITGPNMCRSPKLLKRYFLTPAYKDSQLGPMPDYRKVLRLDMRDAAYLKLLGLDDDSE